MKNLNNKFISLLIITESSNKEVNKNVVKPKSSARDQVISK